MEPTEPNPLTPELREAEETLEAALAEACAAKPASEIDTGELIHVEEMLAVASDAAKRAVSLRRKRRVDSEDRAASGGQRARAGRAAMADAEAAASRSAVHRTFTGEGGVTWDVFAVYPEARLSPHSQLKGTFSQGWLCYDSGVEKRRLSPIPDDWQTLSDQELERLAARAEVAARKRGRSSSQPGPAEPRPSDG